MPTREGPGIKVLFNELHRRRVFRTLAYYVVGSWLLLQAADVLFPAWDIPESGIRFVLYALLLGLPAVLVFAWFFDVGAEGIRRTLPAQSDDPQALRGRDYLLLTALLAVVVAIGYGTLGDLVDPSSPEPATAQTPAPGQGQTGGEETIVAVLPFTTEGSSEESSLFAAGVHDDLLTQLSRLGSLRVISRASVQGFSGENRDLGAIGRQLGAGSIVEGVVRVAGDQIRINAQLSDAAEGALLWADSFDRTLSTENLFAVQKDIAQAITRALDAELTPEESRQLELIPTSSMAAYRAYRSAMDRHASEMGKPEFRADLERAVELDPEFSQALAELAGTYSLASRRPTPERQTYLEQAEAAIDQLARVAPDSVELLFAQSYYVYYVLNDYPRALALVERALERAPSNLRLLQLKSWIQRRQGDFEGRQPTLQQIAQLDPLDDSRRVSMALNLYLLHRYDEAWALMKPVDADNPRLFATYALLANRHIERYEDRLQAYAEQLLNNPHSSPVDRTMLQLSLRDYEGAMTTAREFERPPHWPEPSLTWVQMTELMVYWLQGDEPGLAQAVAEARQRAERLVAENPALRGYVYFERDMLLLDVLEGNAQEALRGLRAWERETLSDWAIRISDREMMCGMYAMLELAQETVDCLRTGLEEPSQVDPFMSPWRPFFDSVRETPEFQAFLAEL